MRRIFRRLAGGLTALFRRSRVERELDAELSEFLATAFEQKMRAGASREAATRAARLELGSRALAFLPHRSTREAIALAIHLVVHIARVHGHRRVTQLLAIKEYDGHNDRFVLESCVEGRRVCEGVVV